ncbi:universal stress protein [Planobispora rosea]|uniref:Universal stress protein n=1 Tax=Planobispora rosea TaxID=35762 RepID=A0A8J3WFL6_PLARO|nr:universal stress protein [Planobispora rosea]GGS94943.1 universal stress protein [Planobispora rosea]GIH87453.1 universal stress protein [Planobispora rosea]
MPDPVVVGTDGSAAGSAAVEWAADDAARMRAPLRVVFAADRPPYDIPRLSAQEWGDALTRNAERVLAEAEALARKRQPEIKVTTRVIEGAPAVVLREQAESAAEVVIGSRGLGGFAGAVLGSVSVHVAGHARGPVVVVHSGARETYGEIVVGIDDSPQCDPALAYAFEQAALRGARLRAVHAWQLPVHAYAPELLSDMEEIRRARRRVVADKLASWRQTYPKATVVEDVRPAHPVEALSAASEQADLVVVGSHGRGALGSLALGSVSRGVLHHARGAVAVVRSPRA